MVTFLRDPGVIGLVLQASIFLLLGTGELQPAAEERAEKKSSETVTVEGAEAMRLAVRLAREAMEDKDFTRSREILKRVVDASQFDELPAADRVAALFALGRTNDALGEHREAVHLYRRILVDHPGLVRVRLELGRSFFLAGDDQLADYHFRFALAGDLPEVVEGKVRNYLNRIRLRRRWTVDLGMRFVRNTNINVAPTVRQIELFGLPFELDDDAREKSGVGIGGFVSGDYRHPLAGRLQIRVGGHLDHISYSDSRFNDTIFAGHAGPHLPFDAGRLGTAEASFLFQGYRRWFGGEKLSYGLGPAMAISVEPRDRLRLAARVDHLFIRYDEHGDFDGTMTLATVRPTLILSPSSYLTFTGGIVYDRTNSSHLRNWQYRGGIGYHKDLPRGFTIGIEPGYRYVTYDRDWPAFETRRRDEVLDIQIGLLNRRIDLFGFTPVVNYRYQNRSSTVELYDYNQHRAELSLTRHF